jgi:ferredoxin
MAGSEPLPTAGKKRLKVIADRSACCGYGICAETCPQVYKLDDNGVVTIAVEFVPPEFEEKAREGAASCPQSALAVEEV